MIKIFPEGKMSFSDMHIHETLLFTYRKKKTTTLCSGADQTHSTCAIL